MSRSGYVDDYWDNTTGLWRGAVSQAINGERGQAFLKELAKTLDEMPVKRLITGELITEAGEVCAIGAVCKARKLDVKDVDIEDPEEVGKLVGVARALAAEIEYENDEKDWCWDGKETPEERWVRMRKWVQENIKDTNAK